MTTTEFSWPPLAPGGPRPVWTGNGFDVGGEQVSLLSYGVGQSGWTDDLTNLHEGAAGAAHPVDAASRRHAVRELQKHLPSAQGVVLEVGCSSGYLLRDMVRDLPGAFVIGADYVRGPLESLARSLAGVPVLQFDLQECPLPDASLDAVVLLNVLEHIEDDVRAVRQLFRILKPGGVAVVEVPAGPDLFDVYDKTLMHFRRYDLKGAASMFGDAGFRVLKASHLGFFVYPGFWAVKKKRRWFASAEDGPRLVAGDIKNTGSSVLLSSLMKLELALGEKISFPVGIRCLLTCRKPT